MKSLELEPMNSTVMEPEVENVVRFTHSQANHEPPEVETEKIVEEYKESADSKALLSPAPNVARP